MTPTNSVSIAMSACSYPAFPWAKWLRNLTMPSAWTLTPADVDVTPQGFKELLQIACYEHGFNIFGWRVGRGTHTNAALISFTLKPIPGKARQPAHDYVVRLWDDGRREERYGAVTPFEWPWAEWFSQPETKLIYPLDFTKKPGLMARHIRDTAKQYAQIVEVRRDAYLPDNWAGITIRRDMSSPPYVRRPGGRPSGPPKPAKVRGPIGRPEKHPWGAWLDGRRHVLARGVDFDMPAQHFAIMARAKANTARYPFGVTVQQRGQVVTVQARIEEAI